MSIYLYVDMVAVYTYIYTWWHCEYISLCRHGGCLYLYIDMVAL